MVVYFVSRNGHQEGPHSLELIEDKIKSGYLAPHDYLYNPKVNDWVLLSKFELTKSFCEYLSKRDEITKPIEVEKENNHWFLLRDNTQMGPFDYKDIVQMLQDKTAFEFDYVWSPSMEAWELISACGHFTKEKMKPFIDPKRAGFNMHYRRSSPRVHHGSSLIIHNNKKLWNATGFEISSGGAGVEIPLHSFKKGEALTLHFRPSKEVPAFNVHCEVMNCMKSSSEGEPVKFRLGLRFVRVNSSMQTALKKIVEQKAA
ncbi:MAG: hypothetical protein RJB66_943 [Pseudomonadota bacterium]|jgi:hypothetical protein